MTLGAVKEALNKLKKNELYNIAHQVEARPYPLKSHSKTELAESITRIMREYAYALRYTFHPEKYLEDKKAGETYLFYE